MTIYQNSPHIYQEGTLLRPHETQLRFEAKVMDADYLLEPNSYGEYICTLMPLNMDDNQRFFEAAEQCLMLVEMRKDPYSRKVATAQYEDRKGFIIANQLFKAKLNIDVEHPDYLYNRDVSIAGHFRDLANGNVVFNIDYADFYEENRRTAFQIELESNPDGGCDLDF